MKHATARLPLPFPRLSLAAAADAATATKVPQLPLQNPSSCYNYPYLPRLLRSCKDLNSLLQIHGRFLVSGYEFDNFSLTQLVNSYASFHRSDTARLVFDSASPNPSIVLWNSMIRAYTRNNQHRDALELFHGMRERGVEPDKYTFTFALKACTGVLDFEVGVWIHHSVVDKGLEHDVYVGTGLVDMYCKLGRIEIARELFEQMPKLDVVAWNAMIAGFSQSGDADDALGFFRKMQSVGVEPNSVSLLNLFPAICQVSAPLLCRSVHGFVVRRDFPSVVSNGLIDLYSKCRNVYSARQIFDRMSGRDGVSWGTMIAGYAHNAYFVEALELFYYLIAKNMKPNLVAVVGALSAAAEMRHLEKGTDIHTYLIQSGMSLDISVVTSLVTMYARCGNLDMAKLMFDGIPQKDMVAWSAMISALVQTGHPKEAVSLFREMQSVYIRPNRVTIVSALPACAELSALNLGKSIHCYMIKATISLDVSTGTALVAMYAKCRCFTLAHVLFDMLPHKDVVTWNALINGYAQAGDANNVMKMFHQLRLVGCCPDSGTMVGVLPACMLLGALDQGMCVHGQIIKSGFESDLHVKNAVIDMYAKCGSLSSAEFLFDEAEFVKDEISWNIMIAGYMQNGKATEALCTLRWMKAEDFHPNLVTVVSILPAAAYLADLREGMALHACVISTGLESYTLVGNCLIDMYAKCGRLDFSQKFFDMMVDRDTVSWNAMLSGYAIHGYGEDAVALFLQMQESCVKVDSVSFVSVLSACRHGGLVDDGRKIFDAMRSKYALEPDVEHYACMVDMLGRAGHLDEAWNLIQTMPMKPDAGVWGALLGACRMHSNITLGEIALDQLVRLEPQNPAHYVVLSNIYAQVGRWTDVGRMRMTMSITGLKKTPGCSWVVVKDTVHAFRVGDCTHPQFKSICVVWNELHEKMESMGYVPDTSCVLQNVEEEEKELFLSTHSERLAIAFAILNTEPGVTIQIVKNLRVCSDCHTVTKLISEITNRTIIVRDASRFHRFDGGICSCKDYW